MSRPEDSGMRNARGFTLIELLIVMAILAMLAALVGPALFGNLIKGQRSAAENQIDSLGIALDSYRLDVNRYPESLEALVRNVSGHPSWAGPYLRSDEVPLDPWDNEFQYEIVDGGRDFELISYGADGVPGGQDENADIGG